MSEGEKAVANNYLVGTPDGLRCLECVQKRHPHDFSVPCPFPSCRCKGYSPKLKVRPAAEWFSTKFPVDLVMSPWQEWSCKACGEWLAGNKGDPVVQMTLEFHVKRHEDAGDVLP